MIGRPTTIRARLTAWFAVGMAAVLVVFAAGVFLLVRASLISQVRERLHTQLSAAAKFVGDNPGDVAELGEFNPDSLILVLKGNEVELRSRAWERIGLPAVGDINATKDEWIWETPSDWHYLLAAQAVQTPERVFTVVVAVDEESSLRSLTTLAWTIGLSLPVVLGLSVLGGYMLAGRMLAPVRRMAEAGERISSGRLGDRLPVENAADEFGRLATITNRSLDRLVETLDRQRRFTADASHEMRTPLTAIRSAGEVALRRVQKPEEYRETIGAMLEGVGRLTDLIERLLLLARADAGTQPIKPEVFDAADVVREVTDLIRPIADEKQITIAASGGDRHTVNTDRLLLRQAVLNVIDNAVKYTPVGGTIHIETAARDGSLTIVIRDSGPGVAPEHREKVFERFFRVDTARARGGGASDLSGGAGLGLAIAKWAVEACGGQITLDSEVGNGSTFTLTVPTPPRSTPHLRMARAV